MQFIWSAFPRWLIDAKETPLFHQRQSWYSSFFPRTRSCSALVRFDAICYLISGTLWANNEKDTLMISCCKSGAAAAQKGLRHAGTWQRHGRGRNVCMYVCMYARVNFPYTYNLCSPAMKYVRVMTTGRSDPSHYPLLQSLSFLCTSRLVAALQIMHFLPLMEEIWNVHHIRPRIPSEAKLRWDYLSPPSMLEAPSI